MIDLVEAHRARSIDDMQQHVRMDRLFKRCAEGRHELVWQLPNKPDRIGDHDLPRFVAEKNTARGRIERGEELVCRIRLCLRQRIEECRFPGIGITDERHRQGPIALALPPLRAVLPFEFLEPHLEHLDALADEAAVRFELRFTRTAQPDTAFLTLEVSPRAHEPRGNVLQLREFHLKLAFMATGALRENVEDEAGAVDDAPVKRSLQIALLRGRQRVIEDDDVDVIRFTG